jgi:hypothetical protein
MKMKVVSYDSETFCHQCIPLDWDDKWPEDLPIQPPVGQAWDIDLLVTAALGGPPEVYVGKIIEVDYVFPFVLLPGYISSVEDA